MACRSSPLRGIVECEDLGPPVHGDGELLPRQMGGTAGGPLRQVTHAHRVAVPKLNQKVPCRK